MPEELVTYDQVETGDPDPLGLEKKLKAAKAAKPASPDPLGLEAKLRAIKERAQPKQEQPAFQVSITEPTFRNIPQTTVTTHGPVAATSNIKKEEIKYIPDEKTVEINKQAGKARVAHEKVNAALVSNDTQYEKKLRESRKENYTIESLRNEYKQKGQILAPQDEQKLLQQEKERQYNLPVTSDDITDFKTGTILTPNLARKFVKDLNDKEITESAYQVDKFNEIANDPDPYAHKRIEKINENAKAIKKGIYVYDPETKTLMQPLGLVGSLIEGTANKFKADEEHDFLKNTSNDAAIIMELEDERSNPKLDEPIKVPRGKVGEALKTAAEMPLMPIVAGIAGTIGGTFIGNPELGTVAATALGAYENRKAQFRATFKQVYNELRNQGRSEFEALSEARRQAENAQEIGTIIGGAQGLIGAKISAIPIKGTNFNIGFQQAIGDFLKKNGNEFGKIALDAVAQGGLAVSGEVVKNKLAQSAGIKRDLDSGAADAFWGNVLMTGGIAAALKLGRGMSNINYKKILSGLTKNVPEEIINAALQEKVASGEITQQAADQALQEINQYKGLDMLIPENVTEEARFKIQDKIQKRVELEKQIETTDKAYHPAIKEKIKAIDEEIIALSKDTEITPKPESGLTKEKEKEAIDFAHELVDEGILPDNYWEEVKKDPIKFWQTVAQQTQNRDENWKPLSRPLDEQSVRDNYGDTVVDYAKELFPAPEIKESSISVIQPGEIKHPETITISPRERPTEVKSTDKVSVIMPKGRESETITIKPKEDAVQIGGPEATIVDETSGGSPQMESRVPEPGETTIPQERGIPAEEGKATGQEGVGAPREIGITHMQMDNLAEELGLPTYEKSPEKIAEWDERAAKMLAEDPQSLPNLFDKLRRGENPGPEETRMMLQYMGDLMAKVDKDPYNRGLQDQLLRTKDLFNIAGRTQGKSLAARKGSIPVEETLSDFIIRDREANKAPLTDEQITVSKKEYEDIKAAKDAFEAKLAAEKEKAVKQKAEKVVSEESKKVKKQAGKDFTTERNQIIEDIAKKWKGSRGQISATFIPYADRLIKIAPDVVKLMKTYVEQGISELPKLVKAIHTAIKDHIDGITEKDVHDIIAGEYNEKKATRSQLAQQIYDIRKEASLINELEQLLSGETLTSVKKQRQRNQKIESLRNQIKELKDEIGLNDKSEADKLSSLKARYKKQINDLERKIAAGDYGPEVTPKPIKLDKEAIELKDKMIKLKLDREARLAKQEYENRTDIQKAKDMGADALDAVRTIQTNPDLSFFGRQGIKYFVTHPIKGPKLFWESVLQAKSQKRYDRWLYDIHNSSAWKLIEDSGLAVLDPSTLHASMREEQWKSQLIHKIPVAGQVAKASERAFTSAANMARVDWFMEGVDILRKQGKTWENSPEEYKGWASAVNNMTGRGGLGALEPAVGQLAIPFWSPRLIASNVNLFLNPLYYTKMPKSARMMLIKNMAQYIVTGVAFLGLAKTMGAEVEYDPRSSDFGKLKVGNTRYDVWGGAAQYIRAFAQLFTASRKTGGKVEDLNIRSQVMTGANLVRTKLSPIFGFAIDAKLGENVVGEKVEWADAYKLMIPMLYNDIKEAASDKKGGPETAAIVGLLSFLGIGANTYGDKSKSSTAPIQYRERPTRLKQTRTNPYKK